MAVHHAAEPIGVQTVLALVGLALLTWAAVALLRHLARPPRPRPPRRTGLEPDVCPPCQVCNYPGNVITNPIMHHGHPIPPGAIRR